MSSIGAAIVARNDFYGGNLVERASYAINSLISTLDEIIYVDWNTVNNKTLIEEIYDNLIETDKLKIIKVNPDVVGTFTNHSPNAQVVNETLGKNLGLRRLTTDFMLSTSIEDICPTREYLDKLTDKNTFYIGARRNTQLSNVQACGGYKDFPQVQNELDKIKDLIPQVGPSGAYPGDVWSLIDCCGDFHFASREIWYAVKGFEESLIGRGFMDTNLQKKVMLEGYKLEVHKELPVFHINHGGGFGGSGGINDRDFSIRNFVKSTNKDTWGFSDCKVDLIPMKELRSK